VNLLDVVINGNSYDGAELVIIIAAVLVIIACVFYIIDRVR